MLRLEQSQQAFMRALDHGPAWLPDDLFAGGHATVLRGMKVHANTISHARLVALEDTFPRTRAALGDSGFNAHSRAFLEWPGVSAAPLASIGARFADYLAANAVDAALAPLADFEWAWLSAYHAADAHALQLAALAGIAEDALMAIVVARHPAAAMVAPAPAIGGEVAGLDHVEGILLTRPEAEVLIAPADPEMARIFAALDVAQPLCNLFAEDDEPERKDNAPPRDTLDALVRLIGAGALLRRD